MELKKLNDEMFVSSQITCDDIAHIASQGIKTVICNRPDGEVAGQPSIDSITQVALEAGLDILFLPVNGGSITTENIEQFLALNEQVNTPVLAYCRTGTRSTRLWGLGEATKGVPIDQIITIAAGAGYNLAKYAPKLKAASIVS